MPCHRCHGLMVPDHPACFCVDADTVIIEDSPLDAWKCVNCGSYTDAVIRENQARQLAERWLLVEAEALVAQVSAPHVA